ncbi:MAG: MlaD family protein [Candidatus Binataceae bacterium]
MAFFCGAASARVIRSVVLAAALVGCAADPVRYGAAFNQADGLGPGDAVTRDGVMIGSVTAISPVAGGDSQVSVQLDHDYASTVRNDSILILQGAGTAPSLELMSPDPSSPRAVEGSQLYGASNESQAQLFLSSLGPPTFVGQYTQLFNRMQAPQPSPSPGSAVLQNQLVDIMRQTLAAASAATNATPTGQAQLDQFREDADAVQRQLVAHGRPADAARLRDEVQQMNAAAGAAPGTLTVPRAVPTP